jgi:hypothetical protein
MSGMSWDGMSWDGMSWDGMSWDGMEHIMRMMVFEKEESGPGVCDIDLLSFGC